MVLWEGYLRESPLVITTPTTTNVNLKYIHKVFWNIPKAYLRTILVVLHNKCMTRLKFKKVLEVCKLA